MNWLGVFNTLVEMAWFTIKLVVKVLLLLAICLGFVYLLTRIDEPLVDAFFATLFAVPVVLALFFWFLTTYDKHRYDGWKK